MISLPTYAFRLLFIPHVSLTTITSIFPSIAMLKIVIVSGLLHMID